MKQSLRSRLRAGDPEAFREIYQSQVKAIYRHAYRVTGDWSAAEDVVALTFLEVWRLREKLEANDESVRPWLFGIATNVLRNTGRAGRRHQEAMARLPVNEQVPDIADEVVGRVDDTKELAAARVALGSLRHQEREVIMLCVWSGLDYAAASVALGVRIGTVRSRLSRARHRLRKLTDQELRRHGEMLEPTAPRKQVQDDRSSAVRRRQEMN